MIVRVRRARRPGATATTARAAPRAWRDVAVVWAVSRLAFFVAGAAGHAFISDADFVGAYRPPSGTLAYWGNWDGAWFLHIAQHGYDTASTTAFFPLYPIVTRGLMEVGLGAAVAGVVLSTAAALAALFFLYRLAQHWFDVRAARAAVVAFAFLPPAFFLNAAYSESLFLALTGGSLCALYVRGDILIAGALGYLAAATRNVGVLLALPIAVEWLRRRREVGAETVVGVLGPPLGLAAYCLYLWRAAHKPLLFAVAEKATWGRSATNPLVTVKHGWEQAGAGWSYLAHPARVFGTTSANPPFAVADSVNFVFLVIVAALLVIGFRRLPFPVWLYCAGAAVSPLLLPGPQVALVSYPRYALGALPLFALLGRLLSRWRIGFALWLVAAAALGLYLVLEFVTLRWVA